MRRCLALLLLGLVLLGLVVLGLGAEEVPLLVVGETTEHTLEVGGTCRFALDLDAGDTFNVIAWQRGTDLRMRLLSSEGELIEVVDRFHNTRDREDLFRIVETGGRYSVEVSAVEPTAEGAFRIRLDDRRPAAEQDRRLLPHWRAYDEARGLQITRQGNPESLRRAIWLYSSTLEAWRQVGDEATAASTLDNLGFCHRLLGELDAAVTWYDRALERWRVAGLALEEANTWINRATAEGRRDHHAQAREGFQQALDLLRGFRAENEKEKGRAAFLLSRVLDGLGTAQKDLGELVVAEQNLHQALDLRRQQGDPQPLAFTLNNLAAVKLRLGDLHTAFELLDEALALASTLENDTVKAAVLSNFGVAHEWSGELLLAVEVFRASLELNQGLGDHRAQAEVWRNLGTAYFGLGDYEEAQSCFGRARRLNRQLGRSVAEADNLVNLGWTFSLQGHLPQALDALVRGEEILLRQPAGEAAPGRPFLLAFVREKLGRVHAELGDAVTGQRELEEAERLARAAHDLRRQGRIALGLGEIAEQRGNVPEARRAFASAEGLARQAGDLWTRADALASRARVERRVGQLGLAQRRVEDSLELVEQARTAAGEPLWRASLVAARIGTYELATAIAMERHRKEPGHGHDLAAFAFHQRARGRSLLDQVALETAVDDNAAGGLERDLRRQVNAAERAVEEFPERGGTPELYGLLVAKRDRLLAAHRAASAQLVPRDGHGDLRSAEPLSLEILQQRVVDSGTALLVYALGEERSFLFAITDSTFESHELPPRGVIEGLAMELRGLLVAPKVRTRETLTLSARQQLAVDLESDVRRYPALARRLGEVLLGPLWDERFKAGGGLERLAVVVDGALTALPFAVLMAPATEEPLVASHQVVQLPSPSVLAAARSRVQQPGAGSTRPRATKDLAIFADPVLTPSDARLPTERPSPAAPRPGETEPASSLSAAARGALRRLPGTGREAEAILGFVAPEARQKQVVLYEGFAASREAFLSPDLGNYKILHVATHGFVHPRHAALSGLVFSLFDTTGKERDGVVRLHDMRGLHLGADLVVLSACETGLGQELVGEGLLGLVYGFFQAGVPRVVASLWQVNDTATAELMKRFYAGIFERHEPAAQALAKAQASMWRDPLYKAWRHPYYWSGFVLFGDWR